MVPVRFCTFGYRFFYWLLPHRTCTFVYRSSLHCPRLPFVTLPHTFGSMPRYAHTFSVCHRHTGLFYVLPHFGSRTAAVHGCSPYTVTGSPCIYPYTLWTYARSQFPTHRPVPGSFGFALHLVGCSYAVTHGCHVYTTHTRARGCRTFTFTFWFATRTAPLCRFSVMPVTLRLVRSRLPRALPRTTHHTLPTTLRLPVGYGYLRTVHLRITAHGYRGYIHSSPTAPFRLDWLQFTVTHGLVTVTRLHTVRTFMPHILVAARSVYLVYIHTPHTLLPTTHTRLQFTTRSTHYRSFTVVILPDLLILLRCYGLRTFLPLPLRYTRLFAPHTRSLPLRYCTRGFVRSFCVTHVWLRLPSPFATFRTRFCTRTVAAHAPLQFCLGLQFTFGSPCVLYVCLVYQYTRGFYRFVRSWLPTVTLYCVATVTRVPAVTIRSRYVALLAFPAHVPRFVTLDYLPRSFAFTRLGYAVTGWLRSTRHTRTFIYISFDLHHTHYVLLIYIPFRIYVCYAVDLFTVPHLPLRCYRAFLRFTTVYTYLSRVLRLPFVTVGSFTRAAHAHVRILPLPVAVTFYYAFVWFGWLRFAAPFSPRGSHTHGCALPRHHPTILCGYRFFCTRCWPYAAWLLDCLPATRLLVLFC